MRAPHRPFRPLHRVLRALLTFALCLGLSVPVSFAVREVVDWVGMRTDGVAREVQQGRVATASRAEAEREVERIREVIAREGDLSFVSDVTLDDDLRGIRLLVGDPGAVSEEAEDDLRALVGSPLRVRLEFNAGVSEASGDPGRPAPSDEDTPTAHSPDGDGDGGDRSGGDRNSSDGHSTEGGPVDSAPADSAPGGGRDQGRSPYHSGGPATPGDGGADDLSTDRTEGTPGATTPPGATPGPPDPPGVPHVPEPPNPPDPPKSPGAPAPPTSPHAPNPPDTPNRPNKPGSDPQDAPRRGAPAAPGLTSEEPDHPLHADRPGDNSP